MPASIAIHSVPTMPRRSAADLATPRIATEPRWLEPPKHLTDAERSLFVELVEACAPNHFVKSDLPLLTSYVQATLLSRRAVNTAFDDKDSLAIWERATKMQVSLAAKLRLAPQQRADPKTIARNTPKPFRAPWDIGSLRDTGDDELAE